MKTNYIKFVRSKLQNVDETQYEVKNKIVRHLTQKGWEMDLIIKCLNQLTK